MRKRSCTVGGSRVADVGTITATDSACAVAVDVIPSAKTTTMMMMMTTTTPSMAAAVTTLLMLLLLGGIGTAQSFNLPGATCTRILRYIPQSTRIDSPTGPLQQTPDGPAGSFFHPVPDDSSGNDGDDGNDDDDDDIGNSRISPVLGRADGTAKSNDDESLESKIGDSKSDSDKNVPPEFDDAVLEVLRQRRKPPRASRPSTINGVPTEKVIGFGKPPPSKKPYIAIGPDATVIPVNSVQPINDPSKPEVDDQGYTLYTNEQTGEKKRVFDALVDYPCKFTLKIVGANEGTFVQDIVGLVADACDVSPADIQHSTKVMGKWTSVTVQAPVESAVMLYSLYEKVDLDPRVKFKF